MTYARKRGSGLGAQTGSDGIPFELIMADGSLHDAPGSLVFVDRNVDARTGTIMAEAAFANPKSILRPGQYARVRAVIEQHAGAILVPQRCVRETQGVFSVLALGAGDTVEQRLVMPGERIGSLWLITSGLQAGDRVVVEGQQKVRPGAKVNPETTVIEEKETPVVPGGGTPPAETAPDEKKAGEKKAE